MGKGTVSMSTEIESQAQGLRKTLVGVVVSTKMQKTVVVAVSRKVRHPKYRKYVTSRRRFMVHDEHNECRVGDEVEIIETRPLSRLKRWRLNEIKARGEISRA
jgi:small subunit ribosomal protein S17